MIIKIMTMKRYTTISVMPETVEALAELMPKSWDWDRVLHELTEMWKQQQGKTTKVGKSAQDNQAS